MHGSTRVLVLLVGVLVVLVFCAGSIGRGATHAGISIRMFRAGTNAGPVAITSGPDGAVWFTNERARSVGRITSSGSISARAASGVSASPGAITAGRDGALWFVDGGNKIARLSPRGALTEFPVPSAFDIAAGPDGALWFTSGGEWVGRMTTSGKTSLFVDHSRFRGTYGIARGRDGAMWFTNYLGSSIARVDETGSVTTFSAPCVRYPTGITAGPDGALWFADDSGRIGRITTAGRVTCFGDSAHVGHPDAIVAADGALWAADRGGSIVRVTTNGGTARDAAKGMCLPDAIAAGPNGTVWFADYGANAVGRIARTASPTKPVRLPSRPRVTFVSDSIGAAIAFDTGAKSILASGVDLFLDPAAARTLGPWPLDGEGPQSVLELVAQLGRNLGRTVVVEIGNNDFASTYAANMEAALTELRSAGVKRVLWLTLHVTPNHTSLATMNDAIAIAAVRHPELTVLDWNGYAAAHPGWFQPDGLHLTGDGPRALARFIHAGLVKLGIPLGNPVRCTHA